MEEAAAGVEQKAGTLPSTGQHQQLHAFGFRGAHPVFSEWGSVCCLSYINMSLLLINKTVQSHFNIFYLTVKSQYNLAKTDEQ